MKDRIRNMSVCERQFERGKRMKIDTFVLMPFTGDLKLCYAGEYKDTAPCTKTDCRARERP